MVDVEANFYAGYVPIVVIGLYILVCLTIIIFGSFVSIKLRLRIFFAKRYHSQQRAHLQDYLKSNHAARRIRMHTLHEEEAPIYYEPFRDKSPSARIDHDI